MDPLTLVLGMVLVYSAVIVGIIASVDKYEKTKKKEMEVKQIESLLKDIKSSLDKKD